MLQPDLVLTSTSGLTCYDVVIQYFLKENESSEPLKMLLTMLFGAETWEATQNKETKALTIQSVVFIGDLTVLITVETNEDTYYYKPRVDCGAHTIGEFTLKKFVPYDIVRDYVGSDFLCNVQITFGINSTILDWWTALLDDIIAYIPVEFPVPDNILGGYGGLFDIELIYFGDYDGKLRGVINQFSSDHDWAMFWDKQAGKATLSTNFLLTVENRIIKIKVSIENPRLDVELLIHQEEDANKILYRSMREDDPGYQQMLLEQLGALDD